MRRLALPIVAVVVLLAAVTALVVWAAPPPAQQPIAFNHQLHAEENGMDCTDCHLYAESGVRATIPNVGACSDCHSEAMSESEAELRLIEFVEAEEPIPWQKVYWLPDHVFFSHRRHTQVAELECEVCHGSMADRVEPVARQAVPISMNACMDCHDEMGASNDCILCHR